MNKEIVIEIRGVGFVNKGAELMLNAIQQELNRKFKTVTYIIEVSYSQLADPIKREKLIKNLTKANLGVRLSGTYKKIPLRYVYKFLFKDFRKRIRVVNEQEVNVIFDASGFAFGDQWGASFAKKRITNNILKWSESNKAVILLPQAFGPFYDSELIKEMKHLIRYSNLIFARDPISFDFIKSIDLNAKNIFLRPDFTNLVEPNLDEFVNLYKEKVAIIPNFKMITSQAKKDGESYINLLENIIQIVREKGIEPFFLMHEGKKDEEIAVLINSKLSSPLEIVWEDSAIGIKSIIGSSYAVITSRFHGLVSALSQGVPCLATSWSHKYEMLLKDYDYNEGLISLNSNSAEIQNKLDHILDSASNNQIRKMLTTKAKVQKLLTKEMWSSIYNYLDENHGIR